MAWSDEQYQEYEARNEAAYQRWAKDKEFQEEIGNACSGWTARLEKILIKRTRRNLDYFEEYPYAEDFTLGYTPEEVADQMIESLHVPTLYVVPEKEEESETD